VKPSSPARPAASRGLSLAVLLIVAAAVACDRRTLDPVAGSVSPGDPSCLQDIVPLDVEPAGPWGPHWQRLGAADCRPGSWLVGSAERGQNLEQFRAEVAGNSPPPGSLRVGTLVEPLSAREQQLLPLVREFSALFFQLEVIEMETQPLPESSLASRRGDGAGQYDAVEILRGLAGTCPAESAACLRITGEDLYIPGLQYVFGLAHYEHRVGVVSFHRIWEPRPAVLGGGPSKHSRSEPLRRLLKTSSHELAHQFSISHCVHYRNCLMAGTNSMKENDEGRLELCPLDFEKLRERRGFEPRERFLQLAAFATRNQLYPEARYWQQMAESSESLSRVAGDAPPTKGN